MIKILGLLKRLRGNASGLALSEFALASPLFLALGMVGVESANYALVSMKVSQIAANLADTASRIGQDNPLSLKQIRETDINDAFEAVRLQSGNYKITTYGRVILSSLETNSSGGQWLHWQRCIGKLNVTSTYGVAGNGATGTGFAGMGPAGSEIKAPTGQAVMFVEVQYDYQPLITGRFFAGKRIKSTSAFLVRDPRDLTNANNPANPAPTVTTSSCSSFTT